MRIRSASLGIMLLALCLSAPARADDVTLDLRVTVPASGPQPDRIYLAGSLPVLGPWRPDALPLARRPDGAYGATLRVPRSAVLEFKFTRGAWDSVEKSAAGADVPNRSLQLDRDQVVELKVAAWAAGGPGPATRRASTRTGDIRTHDNFPSQALNNTRTLWVWLPPGYDADPDLRYPVLYFHDGQNVFDAATSFAGEWGADEAADRLIRGQRIAPMILVAIANNRDRMAEYTPSPGPRHTGGAADAYARFLIEEVKPFIDRTYRTRPDRQHTALAGSSLGGLVSLYIAWKHPDTVGSAIVMSPSLFWDNQHLLKAIEANPAPLNHTRLWLDMGSAEGSSASAPQHVANLRKLGAILAATGLKPDADFTCRIIPNAAHNEQAWSQRLPSAIEFLFPLKTPAAR